jgi:hypothetical protein
VARRSAAGSTITRISRRFGDAGASVYGTSEMALP